MLDQVLVGTYTHNPSTSTDYQYNVPVYANDSLVFAEHNMTIQPVTNAGSNVLILFDYFIYSYVLCLVLHQAILTSVR